MFFNLKIARLALVLILGASLSGCATRSIPRSSAGHRPETVFVPILMYHHIQDLSKVSRAKQRWTISPEKFQAQLEWIAREGFHPLTMAQLNAHLRHGQPLPVRPIVLSFDDGWKEHYQTVFPILRKYNLTGTFFIITDSVGHTDFVSWPQLKEMSAAGMDIQAHTVTHPRLEKLPSPKAFQEISKSRQLIESHLNKPVAVFAYPYGSYDDDVIEEVKRAGFESAVSVSGINNGYLTRADQTYTLVRFEVNNTETLQHLAWRKGF